MCLTPRCVPNRPVEFGQWCEKVHKKCVKYGSPNFLCNTKATKFTTIPSPTEWINHLHASLPEGGGRREHQLLGRGSRGKRAGVRVLVGCRVAPGRSSPYAAALVVLLYLSADAFIHACAHEPFGGRGSAPPSVYAAALPPRACRSRATLSSPCTFQSSFGSLRAQGLWPVASRKAAGVTFRLLPWRDAGQLTRHDAKGAAQLDAAPTQEQCALQVSPLRDNLVETLRRVRGLGIRRGPGYSVLSTTRYWFLGGSVRARRRRTKLGSFCRVLTTCSSSSCHRRQRAGSGVFECSLSKEDFLFNVARVSHSAVCTARWADGQPGVTSPPLFHQIGRTSVPRGLVWCSPARVCATQVVASRST